MKKLTIAGVNVDPNREDVYTPVSNIYGFKVTVKYAVDGKFNVLPNKTEVFNNVSEFHNKYKSVGHDRIAIESKAHKTGINFDFDDIEEVIIEHADSFELNF